jgi:hypothetical protein
MLNAKLPTPLRPLLVNGYCDWLMISAIETYQRHNLRIANPSGKIEPGDATLRSLKEVPEKPGKGGKYTNSANELVAKATTPTARDVVDMLLATWPELGPPGARTLAAQFMAETAGGRHCYHWNLGNVKASADQPHYYMPVVWECYSQAEADAYVKKGSGRARIPNESEVKQLGTKYGWKCSNVMVLFTAPHEQCRFRVYSTLKDGAERWLGLHRRIAGSNRDYLRALQSADVAAAAKALKKAQYYTADEGDYASAMRAQKKIVDTTLGPLPPPWK